MAFILLQHLIVKAMKLVLKITGALLLLVLLAIGAASIWVATHGNTLKSYAIAELNKRVDQKVVRSE